MSKNIYKIIFEGQDSIYEIYAKKIEESHIFGFIQVEEFVFGANTSLVVDPGEERLRTEFNEIKRTYIPYQSILRIDEVEKEGTPKIKDIGSGKTSNVSQFPAYPGGHSGNKPKE